MGVGVGLQSYNIDMIVDLVWARGLEPLNSYFLVLCVGAVCKCKCKKVVIVIGYLLFNNYSIIIWLGSIAY